MTTASTPISQLTQAASVNTGDLMVVVQNGVTVKATAAQLTSLASANVINDSTTTLSTTWSSTKIAALHSDNVQIVKNASDLASVNSNTLYLIDGTVDMGSQSIEVPEGGISIAGLNGSRDISQLVSSETGYTMFTSPSGSYSGNVVFESLTISVSGTGSKVFDLDDAGNSNALDIVGVNFVNCKSLGDLTDYRQLLLSTVGFINVADGFTFNGSWTGLSALTSIAINMPASSTLFKEGTSLTFSGSVRSDMNFISVDPTAVFMDFQESNILNADSVSLTNFRTTATDALPNLPSSSVKVRYSNCVGIRDTYPGGQWAISSTAVTSIPSSNTLVKVAGTTTYNDLQWFTDGGGNNSITFDSSQEIEVEVLCRASLSGTNNRQINLVLRKWDDSAGAYENISSSGAVTLNSAGRAEGNFLFGYTTVGENDRIELWGENLTDSDDFTVLEGGLFAIKER